ncbi:MAG: GNAT family N-acetyltransferase [Alphaproteobacteria bacterium]|nr:GNAT family N-acetyltransferase [Alphaproteobacteria bacterium]
MGSSHFRILSSPLTAAGAFADLDPARFPGLNAHPLYGDFTRRLYRAIHPAAHPDRSFLVVDDHGPVAAVPCTVHDGLISMFGLPIPLALRNDMDRSAALKAVATALEHLDAIGDADGASVARIRGSEAESLDHIDHACIARLAKPEAKMNAVVDLSGGEDGIRRGVRDSYRSLVNWGRKQMSTAYVNRDNPDRARFKSYADFHSRTAGAGARSDDYWDVFWTEIEAGGAELSLGYVGDNELIAGTLTTFTAHMAYYTSGTYDRDRFEKPIAHWPIFDSIVRAAQRGQSHYDVGEILPRGTATEKEVQIGFFKKGFADTVALRLEWQVALAPPPA